MGAALRQRPDHVAALYNRGNAHLALLEPGLAAESYRAALRLDPTLVPALNNLGTALHRLKRLDEALLELPASTQSSVPSMPAR